MLFFIFFCCFINAVQFASSTNCPENSQEWESKCYRFVSNTSKFITAELDCINHGGHLASIPNAFTNAFIAQQAATLFQGSQMPDAWLGGSSLMNPKIWTWTDGQAFTFSNWANSSTITGQTCVALELSNGLWMADDCYERKPYICILEKTEATTTRHPQTTSSLPTRTHYLTTLQTKTSTNEATTSSSPTMPSTSASATPSPQQTSSQSTTHLITSTMAPSANANSSSLPLTTQSPSINVTSTTPEATTHLITSTMIPPTEAATSSFPLPSTTSSPITETTAPSQQTSSQRITQSITSTMTASTEAASSSSSIPSTTLFPPTTATSTMHETTTPTTTSIPTNPCPEDWTYFLATSSCYYSSMSFNLTWKDAEDFCVARNAHLASIHSDEELTFVRGILRVWDKWIGLHKTAEGEWKWTDDSATDYFKWQYGNSEFHDSSCVMIIYEFENLYYCDTPHPAVCKMTTQQI